MKQKEHVKDLKSNGRYQNKKQKTDRFIVESSADCEGLPVCLVDPFAKFRPQESMPKESQLIDFLSQCLEKMREKFDCENDINSVNKFLLIERHCGQLIEDLRKENLSDKITSTLIQMRDGLLARRYTEVEELYFAMAIGNGSWNVKLPYLDMEFTTSIKRIIMFWKTDIDTNPQQTDL